MPALASLTINDGQATPVAHTFTPASRKDGIQSYLDQSGGVALGFPKITTQLAEPRGSHKQSSADRKYKCRVSIKVPVMETLGTSDNGLTPPPTRAYESDVHIDFVIPERADLAHRKDILAYAKNLLSDAMVTSLVQDLEGTW